MATVQSARTAHKTIAVNCRLLQQGKLEGIGWFTYEVLRRITRDHPDHRFFFIFDRPFSPDFVFSDNVFPLILRPPTRHPLLWYLWFEWRIPRLLAAIKADLFFSPDGYVSLRSPVPVIPVIHDINFVHRPQDLPFLYRWYYNRFFPRFARKAQRICTVSHFSAGDIAERFSVPPHKISVAWNGASELYRPLSGDDIESVRKQYCDGYPYFIFVGSLHPRKNLLNLLEAYQLFRNKTGSDVRMVIVGDKMWRKGAPDKYPPGVIFTGRLEQEELRSIVGGALAMTFVPWFEGFGIPVLEAMQSGVPVLTSDCTSLPEVGGDAVLYANPGSIKEIANQMERLATQPTLRKELISKGLLQSRKFSWDHTAKEVWRCMQMVIGE